MKVDRAAMDLPCGAYEHYKGDQYLVLGIARDDRDDSVLVIYVRLYPRVGIPMTARPLGDFLATVETAAGPVPRFRYLGSSTA
ncbi:MAG: DUF1653 domain-containing protein [Actinomycetota bacterium]|nr:DUF1653 domain-containing protein [Actinomycetota bacterium]